jgi:spore coat polysaccharide biosynthesis predicted glycosyltransferase SpsG
MSKIEDILYKAHRKGIYNETMSLAQDIKNEDPKIEVEDRYELAYKRAKRTGIKSFPPIN